MPGAGTLRSLCTTSACRSYRCRCSHLLEGTAKHRLGLSVRQIYTTPCQLRVISFVAADLCKHHLPLFVHLPLLLLLLRPSFGLMGLATSGLYAAKPAAADCVRNGCHGMDHAPPVERQGQVSTGRTFNDKGPSCLPRAVFFDQFGPNAKRSGGEISSPRYQLVSTVRSHGTKSTYQGYEKTCFF